MPAYKTPFWGPIDASVDWCEPNYAVTPYVAEFWNAMSSLPMVFCGVAGLILTRKAATTDKRFTLSFLLIILVGIGSTAYHGTLRKSAQFLDEIPMLFTNMALLYCLIETERVRQYPFLPWVMLSYAMFCTTIYVITDWYNMFLFMFGSVQVLLAVLASRVWFRMMSDNKLYRSLLITSIFSVSFGFLLWNIERRFCEQVQSFYFHSLWHLGVAVGGYLFVLTAVVHRARVLGCEAVLDSVIVMPFVRYVHHAA